MSKITYEIVEHDGGWAYRVNGVFSETFSSRELAVAAATRAAGEQTLPGAPALITYEDEQGSWHAEVSSGHDRPETEVDA